jgi:hypothetical protein
MLLGINESLENFKIKRMGLNILGSREVERIDE